MVIDSLRCTARGFRSWVHTAQEKEIDGVWVASVDPEREPAKRIYHGYSRASCVSAQKEMLDHTMANQDMLLIILPSHPLSRIPD